MKIAVIDSGVNIRDELLAKQNIDSFKIEHGVCQTCNEDYSGHGTDIVKIICGQTADPQIVSLQVLNNHNKGSVDALCEAIQYCIETEVDIINLSLGLRDPTHGKIQKLKTFCNEAMEKGTVIISSDHNCGNLESRSYPFAFKEIFGVTSSHYHEAKVKVDYKLNNITFSDNVVSVPDKDRAVLRKGNSFLTPVITGLYCEFLREKIHRSDHQSDFLMLMERIERNQTNLFFNRHKEQCYRQFKHKRIGYLYIKKTINDVHVIKLLDQLTTVSLINLASETDTAFTFISEKLDFLFFGDISKGEAEEYKPLLLKMIETAVRQGIHIVMVIPFMSIYQRLLLSEKFKVSIQSIYI